MGNLISIRKTCRTLGSATRRATSVREGGPQACSHGVSWCEFRLLFIAPRKRRKRISCLVSYFLLFLLPFVFAESVFSLRYALLRRSSEDCVKRNLDRVFGILGSHRIGQSTVPYRFEVSTLTFYVHFRSLSISFSFIRAHFMISLVQRQPPSLEQERSRLESF